MTEFHDVLFPASLAKNAIRRVEQATEVIRLSSGREVRNSRWQNARRSWEVDTLLSNLRDVQVLMDFFVARRSRLYGFRFRDPLEFSSASAGQVIGFEDQVIGVGDAVSRNFQLVKTAGEMTRLITKPVRGSVRVGVNGREFGSRWAVDDTSGIVSFEVPPRIGARITAGFEFDTPVRFGADEIKIVMQASMAARATRVELVEIVGEHE